MKTRFLLLAFAVILTLLILVYIARNQQANSTATPSPESTDPIYRVPKSTAQVIRATANAAVNMAISAEPPRFPTDPVTKRQ